MSSASELRDTRRVLLLADGNKPVALSLASEVTAWLEERSLAVDVEQDVRSLEGAYKGERPDLVVVLGGDGSVLGAVRLFAEAPVPVVGVNLGRVGFLAPVQVDDWRAGLDEVLAGDARIEPRMMLETEVHAKARSARSTRAVALNDLVVSRGSTSGLVTVRVHADGDLVGDFRADGLIFATPSGSTAYSLAAGGPILAPDMQGILATPLAAHALTGRPLVLHPDASLDAEVVEASGLVTLSVDGQGFHPLEEGDHFSVKRHRNAYPLMSPRATDPWRRLRDRLGWSAGVWRGNA